MINDRFSNLSRYYDSVPYLEEICDELYGKDLTSLEVGTYYTAKSHIKYMVQSYETRSDKKAEAHKAFADLQLVVSGKETFGVAVKSELPPSFSDEDDIGFYDYDLESSIILSPGDAVIVFPCEPHTPGCTFREPEMVRKIVVKIPFSL